MNAVIFLHLLGMAGDDESESRESLGRPEDSSSSTDASNPPLNHEQSTGPVARKSHRAFYLRPTARTPSVSKGDNGAAWKQAGSKTGVTRPSHLADIQTGQEAKAQNQGDDGIQNNGYTDPAVIYLRGSMNGRATACPAEGSQAGESGKGAQQHPKQQRNMDACDRRVAGTID
jgi:hypothetical protein